jgi:hypothetical protein
MVSWPDSDHSAVSPCADDGRNAGQKGAKRPHERDEIRDVHRRHSERIAWRSPFS